MLPLLEEMRRFNKPMVIVSNTPYEAFGVPEWASTAVTFCPSGRENMAAVAKTLFGGIIPPAKLEVKLK